MEELYKEYLRFTSSRFNIGLYKAIVFTYVLKYYKKELHAIYPLASYYLHPESYHLTKFPSQQVQLLELLLLQAL